MEKVLVDFANVNAPVAVKNFMPDLYKEGDKYICILGAGSEAVRGEGNSMDEAFRDWNQKYEEHSRK